MRRIHHNMIKYLDKKLENNFDAKYAIQNKLPRILMAEAAKACVGIRELTGKNDGPLIELIQKTVDRFAGKEPYCMAFVQTILAYAEYKTGIKSKLFPTEHCMTLLRKTGPDMLVQYKPLAGAIPIWNKIKSDEGHTGILISCDDEFFYCVEANTTVGINDGDKLVRDGGGIYLTKRPFANVNNFILKGFIKPY